MTLHIDLYSHKRIISYSMQSLKTVLYASALTATSALGTSPALAQNSIEKNTGFSLEEIVVTARKREESLQNTPISISALTSNDMEVRQIDSSDKLGQTVPNLQFSANAASSGHNSSSSIFIRGIGQTDFTPSTDPGVGFYIDGVYYARSVGAAINLLDLERVEVLRGPQGTLFGRNTIGGAVVLHTKKPTEDFGGMVKATGGSFSRREIVANVNIPFSDTFLSKFTLAKQKRDGYVIRTFDGLDLGDENDFAARASFLWDAAANLELGLVFNYTTENENGTPNVFNSINSAQRFPVFGSFQAGCPGTVPPSPAVSDIDDPRCANNFQDAGPYATNSTGPVTSELDTFGVVLTVKWDLEWMSVKSITAYNEMDSLSLRDADNTPQLILHTKNETDQKQFSQEVQFSGIALDDRLNWLVGLYYFEESAFEDNPVFLPPGFVGSLSNNFDMDNDSRAIFGQLTYDVTNDLHVTFGLRYSKENKNVLALMFATEGESGYTVPNPLDPSPSCAPPFLNGKGVIGDPDIGPCIELKPGELLYEENLNTMSISDVTPMINISYDWSEDVMSYISYSKGFKSGGFNTRIAQPVQTLLDPTARKFLPSYQPEFATTIEVGFKATLMDDMLRLNGAVFSTDYTDMHIVQRDGISPVTYNAGEARIRGAELEWTLIPTPELMISGGIGYIDAEYQSFGDEVLSRGANTNVLGSVDLDDDLAHTPRITANFGVAYAISTSMGSITPRVDIYYQSEVFFDAANTVAISQDSYTLVNASVIFEHSSEAWKAIFAVRNLGDKLYRTGGNSSLHSSSGYAESAYARPREWSLSLVYSF